MQTKFLQIPKFFSREAGKSEKLMQKPSIDGQIPAGARNRRFFPKPNTPCTCQISTPSGCLPGRWQRRDRARPTPFQGRTSHPQNGGALFPMAGEIRRRSQDSLPAAHCSQTARRQPPESPPQPLPEAAFPGFFIVESGDVAVHCHLSPIQGEGFQFQFLSLHP